MNVLVIGAGLFGACIANELSHTNKVTLIEKDSAIMKHASKANHNRIHFGFHYPRSTLTAKQSLEGLVSFLIKFNDAIVSDFPNYYSIASEGSHVSAREFKNFCDEVGISYIEEFPDQKFLNKLKLESCFRVREPVFDFNILKQKVESMVFGSKNIDVKLLTTIADAVERKEGYFVKFSDGTSDEFDFVINATYANLNAVNEQFGIEKQKLLLEDVIIPHFVYQMQPHGLTIMDGEFCTIMPRGKDKNTSLLYHVKHSVLKRGSSIEEISQNRLVDETDIVKKIYEDSTTYMPFLRDAKHIATYRTVRAVFENKSDARLSEIQTYENKNYISVLSGKISTATKIALQLRQMIDGNPYAGKFIV